MMFKRKKIIIFTVQCFFPALKFGKLRSGFLFVVNLRKLSIDGFQ